MHNFLFFRTVGLRILETFYFLVQFVDHDVFQYNVLLQALVLELLLLDVDLRLLNQVQGLALENFITRLKRELF